jgi:hypothetical protein
VVQRIHATDHEAKFCFVNWYYYSVHDEKMDPTGEIWFHLKGYVKPLNKIFHVNHQNGIIQVNNEIPAH